MNEDLQEFGRPAKRRIVFDSGSKNISVFPSDINADVFLCDTARAHTWVSSFQNVAERPIDFISYKPTYLNYVPKSSGTNNNSINGHGYPPYDPDHSIWASISGISGMHIKDSLPTGLSSFPLIQTLSIRTDAFEIPTKRIVPDSDTSDGELRAWSDCSEETKKEVFSFHSVNELDDLCLSPIEYACSANESDLTATHQMVS